jgi:hypothetical protein
MRHALCCAPNTLQSEKIRNPQSEIRNSCRFALCALLYFSESGGRTTITADKKDNADKLRNVGIGKPQPCHREGVINKVIRGPRFEIRILR